MTRILIIAASFVGGYIGYAFMNEKIAMEIWRQVALARVVSFGSLLIGACFYIGLLVSPEYTKTLAQEDSTKSMRIIDRIASKLAWFYVFGFLFFFGWHIGLNSFIDCQFAWNGFLTFVLTFLFANWVSLLIGIAKFALDIIRTISIDHNKKGF